MIPYPLSHIDLPQQTSMNIFVKNSNAFQISMMAIGGDGGSHYGNLPRFFLFIAGKNLVLLQHSFPALSWNCTRARPVFANLLVVCKTEKRLRVCDRSGPLKVISIASASQLSKTLSVTFLAMFSKHSEAIIVSHEAFHARFRPHAPLDFFLGNHD